MNKTKNKYLYFLIWIITFPIVIYILNSFSNIIGVHNFYMIYIIIIIIIFYLTLKNKNGQNIHNSNITSSKKIHTCPKCNKNSLKVEYDNSAYCDNCDYVTSDWEE